MIAATLSNLLPWSLQAAGVVAAAALLPWLFRLDVGGVRYAYWRGVALLCLALPWIQPYKHGQPVAATVTNDVAVATSQAQSSAVAASRADWGVIVLAVLATGILLRLLWLGFGLIRLRRLRRAALMQQPVLIDADLQPALGTHADIRYARDLQQPVTFGIRRPLVLLPEVMRNHPPEIQRAVIGHELLHVKRRDWAWLIVEEIAVCLFWFHPASWWVASRIQCAREEVVDELAVLLTGRRKTYVEALLAFADMTSVVPTAAFARRRHLVRRIALVSKEDVMSSRRIVVTCATMAVIVGLGSWYAVSAFPLHVADQATSGRRDYQMAPGPLELKAHAVTPENPIPRRIRYEEPVLPDSLASVRGAVGVKVTLDDLGRIAEARLVEVSVNGPDFGMNMTGIDSNGFRWLGSHRVTALNVDKGAAIQTAEAFMDAALAAVRQWRYEAPFEAPLAFTVQVRMGKGPEVMEFKPAREGDALRVGGNIKAPAKVKDVRPVYPPIAREAGVSGVVIIEVRVGTDGRIEDGHVLKSIPLLDEAALDAVKQWEFVPTLLNGAPVPIIMTVTVNFYLDPKQ
jgi:TonB family protein